MTVSQNSASLPAQSSALVHGRPAPSGGNLQIAGDELVTQRKPSAQSASAVQPVFVQ
jgi:hypothetical protein